MTSAVSQGASGGERRRMHGGRQRRHRQRRGSAYLLKEQPLRAPGTLPPHPWQRCTWLGVATGGRRQRLALSAHLDEDEKHGGRSRMAD